MMAFAAGLRAPMLCDFLGAESEMSRRDVCPCGGQANWSLYSVLSLEMAFLNIPDSLSCEGEQNLLVEFLLNEVFQGSYRTTRALDRCVYRVIQVRI